MSENPPVYGPYYGEPPCALPVIQPPTGLAPGGDVGGTFWDVKALARGYYVNDQRIEWSGLEATFGAEAQIAPVIKNRWGAWETSVEGEFYLNQPFDKNVLADTAERRSYRANFDVNTFEISKLFVSARNGDWTIEVGKFETPFGRIYFPLYTNLRHDAPFIRTESILWRETGVLLRYHPEHFVVDVAGTNGSEDLDTNSSKALVSRIGLEDEHWALGVSGKVQDGIGSDSQKEFKNHVGIDAMVRWGQFTLSGEAIYDEYGARDPNFNPLKITWPRSIYYRDQSYRPAIPICGIGYYLNLGYEDPPWSGLINYGEFYPGQIGDPKQDIINRRGIVKIAYAFTPHLKTYGVFMAETEGYVAQDNRLRRGVYVLSGLEYGF